MVIHFNGPDVPMVALAGLIVVPQHALPRDDIGERIFEIMA